MHQRYLRPSVEEDVSYLAERLRDADRAELQATGSKPHQALSNGLNWSAEPVTLISPDDAAPLGMAGVVPFPDGIGAVWMLGTDALVNHQFTFLRNCRSWVEEQNEKYSVLFNRVDERNQVHIKWLRWLGFTFIQRHPLYGVEQRPFLEFVRIAHV